MKWNVAGTVYVLVLDVSCLDKSKDTISSGGTVSSKIGRILQFNFGFSRFLIVPECNMPNK